MAWQPASGMAWQLKSAAAIMEQLASSLLALKHVAAKNKIEKSKWPQLSESGGNESIEIAAKRRKASMKEGGGRHQSAAAAKAAAAAIGETASPSAAAASSIIMARLKSWQQHRA